MDYQKAALYSGAFEYESISDGQKKKEFWFNMAALATTVVVGIFCPPAGMALGGALGGYEMLNAAAGKDLLSGRELGTGERWFRFGTGALGVFGGVKGLTSFSKNISMVKGASSTKMEHVVKMMQNSGRSNYKNIMTQAKNLQTAQALLNEKASEAADFKYNMVENPGPLAEIDQGAAGTFSSGKYNMEVLEDPRILYRGGDANGSPLGQYYTSEIPESVAKVRIESAVKPQWIDPRTGELTGESLIDTVYAVEFPAGTTIYKGPAGYQGGIYLGGKEQIFIKAPWENLDGINVISKTPLK